MSAFRAIVVKGVAFLCCVLVCRGSADPILSVASVEGSGSAVTTGMVAGPARPPLYLVTKIHDHSHEDGKGASAAFLLKGYLAEHYLQPTDPSHPRVDWTEEDGSSVKSCVSYPCEEIIETVAVEPCMDSPKLCKLTFVVELAVVRDPRNHSTGMPPNHNPRTPLDPIPCTIKNDRTEEACRRFAYLGINQELRDHETKFHRVKDSQ